MIITLTSILFWVPFAVLVIRILERSGMKMPDNKVFAYICEQRSLKIDTEATIKESFAVFYICILFRILVYVVSIAALAFFSGEEVIDMEFFLNKWRQWDVSNYIRIATGGYTYHVEEGRYTTLVFFPLTAVFIKIVYMLVGNMEAASMITSTICYAVGCTFMYKLLRIDYDKERAIGAVTLISIFPYALFFGTGMSESTFFAMSAISLYYLRKGAFAEFAVFGILTSLSRMVGVVVVCAAIVEIFERYEIIGKIRRKEKVAGILLKTIPFALMPCIGIFIYLLINYNVTGDAFKFLEYQEEVWQQGSQYFGKSIDIIFNQAMNADIIPKFGIWIPGLMCVILMFAAFIYGVRRHRCMYMVFFAACAYVNMSLKWPISVPRYTSALIPLFLIISDFCETNKWSKPLIYSISAVLMGVYLTGYLFSKQIL